MTQAIRLAVWVVFAWMWYVFAAHDIRTEKIRNRHVARAVLGCLAAYAVLAVWTWHGRGRFVYWGFYGVAAAYAAEAAAAALALWLLRVWPAGDAKLFAALGLMLPLLAPLDTSYSWRLVLSALLNTFLPAAVLVVAQALLWLWRTRVGKAWEYARKEGVTRWLAFHLGEEAAQLARRSPLEALRKAGPAKVAWNVFEQGSFFLTMAVLMTALMRLAGESMWASLALSALFYFVWRGVQAVFGRATPALALLACGLLIERAALPWPALLDMIERMAVFGLCLGAGAQLLVNVLGGRGFLGLFVAAVPLAAGLFFSVVHLSPLVWAAGLFAGLAVAAVMLQAKADLNHKKIDELGPNVLLAASSLALLREDPDFYEEHFSTRYPDGLTRSQVEALKEWCRGRAIDRVALQRTLSFAFWIFLGHAATALLGGGDVLAVLLRWTR